MKAEKKAGAAPKLTDKMRAALREVRRQDNEAIDAEPVRKGPCNCGCQKA